MYYYDDDDRAKAVAPLIGKRVTAVTPATSDYTDGVTLFFEEGKSVRIWLDGDCCSHSYYTDPKQFTELLGAIIIQAELREGRSSGNKSSDLDPDGSETEVSWHFLVFTTDKGHVTIDWRNDSNGYYDGSVNIEEGK